MGEIPGTRVGAAVDDSKRGMYFMLDSIDETAERINGYYPLNTAIFRMGVVWILTACTTKNKESFVGINNFAS